MSLALAHLPPAKESRNRDKEGVYLCLIIRFIWMPIWNVSVTMARSRPRQRRSAACIVLRHRAFPSRISICFWGGLFSLILPVLLASSLMGGVAAIVMNSMACSC